MTYLLDTNIISDFLRNPDGAAARRISECPDDELVTSVLVQAELRFGYTKSGVLRLKLAVEMILARLTVLGWDHPADLAYAEIRSSLEKRGERIGQMDMLIAAHAMALDAVLVSDNVKEFSRIPGLKLENWIR